MWVPLLREDKIAIGEEERRPHNSRASSRKGWNLGVPAGGGDDRGAARPRSPSSSRICLSAWVASIGRYGLNLHVSDDSLKRLPERLKVDVKELAGRRVASIDRKDGLKLNFENGDWVLIRPSGTEPLVRIYSESDSPAKSDKLAAEARDWGQFVMKHSQRETIKIRRGRSDTQASALKWREFFRRNINWFFWPSRWPCCFFRMFLGRTA